MKLINIPFFTYCALLIIMLIANSHSIQAQNLTFKVEDSKDTTVFLVKYIGNKLYYADTAEMVNGKVSFDGKKQTPGVLALLLENQKYFEFIYNNEDILIETKSPDFIDNMVVKKSKENMLFLQYINYMKENRNKAQKLQDQLNELKEGDVEEKKKNIISEINKIGDEVVDFQNGIVAENSNTLAAAIIKMSTDIKIPEELKDDKQATYEYYRDHYFDNIDFTDDRLVNTPVFQNKIEYFYSKNVLVQQPDTIIKYISEILNKMPEKSMMYRFTLTNIVSNFEKSKIMGMDKVWNKLVIDYYCSKDDTGIKLAYWMDEDKLDELCKDTKRRLTLMIGETAPNIILPDSTETKWYNLYSTQAEYTILYFWDPDCGHCKKVTPQLGELYNKKLENRDVKIFAVGNATGDDFESWKSFIKKNNLDFINVGVTPKIYQAAKEDPYSIIPSKTTVESINYRDTYDIYSTPRVFILDKDKKIIAKSLSVAQIERLLDDLQDQKDIEKLFELEEDAIEKMN